MSGIAKICTKIALGSKSNDLAYWRAQPYPARLAALEQIRQEFHRWKYGAEPRLQRVCSIVKGTGQDLADLERLGGEE